MSPGDFIVPKSSSDDNSLPLLIKPEPVGSLEANAQYNIDSCRNNSRTPSFTATHDASHVNNFVNQVSVVRENTRLVGADSRCQNQLTIEEEEKTNYSHHFQVI
uniref:Uncharacterized protein n=1 Tax=Trichobilharzia regenti TaxID=157069 RepID=A0AA85IKX2_TRIRE|nr:unnamed protein product [Trichobilharzia regenti]